MHPHLHTDLYPVFKNYSSLQITVVKVQLFRLLSKLYLRKSINMYFPDAIVPECA